MERQQRLRIAIQKSGRLTDHSLDLLARCGLKYSRGKDQLMCYGENMPLDVLFVRDDDIPDLVQEDVCDLGLVGLNVLEEKRLAMHAGHAETALMLALAPDTVHMERAAAYFPPPFPSKTLSADGRPACAWVARDFGPSGVIGDPTTATREQGEAILDSLADSWVKAITELYTMRWVVREEPTWERGHHTGHIQQTLD